MFEQEFEKALHLSDYDIYNLSMAKQREVKRCEREKSNSKQQDNKSLDLLQIASFARERNFDDKELSNFLKRKESSISFSKFSTSNDLKSILDTLKEEFYTPEFSRAYLCVYTKTVLYYSFKKNSKDALSATIEHIRGLDGYEFRFFTEVLFKLARHDNLDNIGGFTKEVRQLTQSAIRNFIKIDKYFPEDAEIMQLFIEIEDFCLLLDKNTPESQYLKASYYVYTYIALELVNLDRPSDGIPFAKEGLFVEDIKDKTFAYNILGLCAIDSYGKLQFAYDIYFSWINNEAVGELLYLLKDYEKQKILFDKDDFIKWKNESPNAYDVSIMYNNIAYVCVSISETYDNKEVRRQDFLNEAANYLRMAIKYYKDADYYSSISVVQIRTGLINDIPDAIENNRFSKALSSARLYLKETEKFKLPNFTNSSKNGEARSGYLFTLLDWLLESFQIKNQRHDTDASANRTPIKYRSILKELYIDRRTATKLEIFFREFSKLSTSTFYQSQYEHKAQDEPTIKEKWEQFLEMFDLFKEHRNDKHNIGEADRNNSIDQIEKELLLLLMLMKQAAVRLKGLLRRQDYSSTNYFFRKSKKDKNIKRNRDKGCPIAYYTTLGNIRFLFDPMTEGQAIGNSESSNSKITGNIGETSKCKSNGEENKENRNNCLTLMHVRHMNDPLEGLMLLRILFEEIETNRAGSQNILFNDLSPEEYREQIYDRNYVFLKAFTERLDKLDMWNRYASDRSSGKDSNGCCVEINPETFTRQDKDTDQRMKSIYNTQDDFNLYRILYICQTGQIVNETDSNVSLYYNTFIKLVVALNDFLNDQYVKAFFVNEWDELVKLTSKITNDILMRIIFVFKPSDYAEEMESRIVIIRTSEQKDMFHVINSPVPKVYITPFHQVYVDKITLGPKAENPDHWLPYLQYKMDGMRQVIKEDPNQGTRISYFPEKISVRKSTIPYQD